MFDDNWACCCVPAGFDEPQDPHQLQRSGFDWTCVHCNETWPLYTPPENRILV